jgi:pilus assembly protein CpaD
METLRLRLPSGALALLAVVLPVAGCAPQTSAWSPAEAPRENKVTFVSLSHVAVFGPGEELLSRVESDRLAAFLAREQIGYGDRVVLIGGDTDPAIRQQHAVMQELARAGIRASPGGPIEGMPVAPGSVRVLVGRYVVTPPTCNNWSKDPHDDFLNMPGSQFGCATARNLGLMVADPADLVMGRNPGLADGDLEARRLEKFRTGGRPAPLPAGASAGGGGSQQGGAGQGAGK